MRPSSLLVPCTLLALSVAARAETLKVPADFATIGGAAAVAEAGDTIVVSKGVYAESVTLATPDVKLVGKKAVIDAQFGGNCITVDADGVSIAGFTLLNGGVGIETQHAGLTVSKCNIATCADDGLLVQGPDATITGNTVTGCGDNGIHFDFDLAGETLIDKNVCRRNGLNGIAVNGIAVVITRNRCEQNEGDGIDVFVDAPVADGVPPGNPTVLEKNDCSGNEDHGIGVASTFSHPFVIHDNDCSGNTDDGLNVNAPNADIQGNRCEDNIDNGLNLATDHSVISGNTASGNADSGIVITGLPPVSDGSISTGDLNTVSKNTCNDNGDDGIVVFVGSGNTFSGNKCSGNGDDGLDIDEDSCANNVVDGNNLSGNGHEGLDNSGTGTDITKNTCKGNGHGICPDIAGAGDDQAGTVDAFQDNSFGTGGDSETAVLDNYSFTAH